MGKCTEGHCNQPSEMKRIGKSVGGVYPVADTGLCCYHTKRAEGLIRPTKAYHVGKRHGKPGNYSMPFRWQGPHLNQDQLKAKLDDARKARKLNPKKSAWGNGFTAAIFKERDERLATNLSDLSEFNGGLG